MTHPKTYNSLGQKWCGKGKHYMDTKYFSKNNNSTDGIDWECKYCRSKMSKEYVDRRIERQIRREFIRKYTVIPMYDRMIFTFSKPNPMNPPTWEVLLKTKLFNNPQRP